MNKADIGNLKRALAKIEFASNTNPITWCGYLTPSEIIVLRKKGATYNSASLKAINARFASGDCEPTWTYFSLPKNSDLYKQLHKQHSRTLNEN